jgi:hypothetical protein
MGPRQVEIKVTFAGETVDRALEALGLKDTEAKERRIFFSEVRVEPGDPLPLTGRGLILRTRLSERGGDTTLKLRGPEACLDVLAWEERTTRWGDNAKIEGDWTGPRHLVAASLDHDLDEEDGETTDPRTPHDVIALLSDAQRTVAREWMIPLNLLEPLGPVLALKWKKTVGGIEPRFDVELWTVGEDLRFLELSVRVQATAATAVQHALNTAVDALGLPVAAGAGTKTEAVLRRLMAPGN